MRVAHRGLSSRHPENTLEAFAAAIDCGAELIEFDVHRSADGTVVVIHDETLDRTTDIVSRSGRSDVRVDATPMATIRELDAGSWFDPTRARCRVPTLAAALGLMSERVIPMIEHKGGDPESLLEVLEATNAIRSVIVQSFDWEFVRRMRQLAPTLALGALGEGELEDGRLEELETLDVGLVHWNQQDLRLTDVTRLAGRGYLTCAYTANTEIELLGCVASGLDAITTNFTDRLSRILELGPQPDGDRSRRPSPA